MFLSFLSKANADFLRALWHFRLPAKNLYIYCQFYNGQCRTYFAMTVIERALHASIGCITNVDLVALTILG
jgi:hypothetical protein